VKPIAITIGDVAGIGPEIIAKTFAQEPALTQGCFVAGELEALRRGTAIAAGDQPPLAIAVIEDLSELAQVPPRCIPLWPVGAPFAKLPPLGEVSADAGRLAADAVLWAAQAALRSPPPACPSPGTPSCCRRRPPCMPAWPWSRCRCA
jgi:4-hydroxythreonine-4-phosphate dehydrogenase